MYMMDYDKEFQRIKDALLVDIREFFVSNPGIVVPWFGQVNIKLAGVFVEDNSPILFTNYQAHDLYEILNKINNFQALENQAENSDLDNPQG